VIWALSLCVWVGCYLWLFFWLIAKDGRRHGMALLAASVGFVGVGSVGLSAVAGAEVARGVGDTSQAGISMWLGSATLTVVVLAGCALIPMAGGIALALERRPAWLEKLTSLSLRDKALICAGIPVLMLSVGWTTLFR
jgi:hypothetical protein